MLSIKVILLTRVIHIKMNYTIFVWKRELGLKITLTITFLIDNTFEN